MSFGPELSQGSSLGRFRVFRVRLRQSSSRRTAPCHGGTQMPTDATRMRRRSAARAGSGAPSSSPTPQRHWSLLDRPRDARWVRGGFRGHGADLRRICADLRASAFPMTWSRPSIGALSEAHPDGMEPAEKGSPVSSAPQRHGAQAEAEPSHARHDSISRHSLRSCGMTRVRGIGDSPRKCRTVPAHRRAPAARITSRRAAGRRGPL